MWDSRFELVGSELWSGWFGFCFVVSYAVLIVRLGAIEEPIEAIVGMQFRPRSLNVF